MSLRNFLLSRQHMKPIVVFVVGVLAGQKSDSIGRFLLWFHQHAESIIVPAYTLLAVLYLSLVAFQSQYPILKHLYDHYILRRPVIAEKRPPIAADVALQAATAAASHAPQPIDLSGAYKLISNDGFEKFLEVQGVPWALRRAANQARPVHRITHQGARLTIKIEGIIETQTSYIIGGSPVETNVRGRIFRDVVTYLEEEDGVVSGIQCQKTAITEDYDVKVQRKLSEDKQQIHMVSTALFRDGRNPIESRQVFQRIE